MKGSELTYGGLRLEVEGLCPNKLTLFAHLISFSLLVHREMNFSRRVVGDKRRLGEFYLTDLREGDENDLIECFQTDEIYKSTLRIPFPYSYDDAIFWIHYCLEQAKEKGILWFFVIRQELGKVIGALSINDIVNGVAEIGYWLSPIYWGQGIMPLCLATFCEILQENSHRYQPEITRLEAHIFKANFQSRRVLEKSGFNYEGEILNHFVKDGVMIDVLKYSRSLSIDNEPCKNKER
jgi:[ribosomal protein S5]-alanine N-acetyltransferase